MDHILSCSGLFREFLNLQTCTERYRFIKYCTDDQVACLTEVLLNWERYGIKSSALREKCKNSLRNYRFWANLDLARRFLIVNTQLLQQLVPYALQYAAETQINCLLSICYAI